MKKRYRVFGNIEVVVSTVVEVEAGTPKEQIFKKAASHFSGVQQCLGNCGRGDKLIGVDGPDDTIFVDSAPTFDDFMEEK